MNLYLSNSAKKCFDSERFHHICQKVKYSPILCKGRFIQGRCRKSCGVCEPDDIATTTSAAIGELDDPKESKDRREGISLMIRLVPISISMFIPILIFNRDVMHFLYIATTVDTTKIAPLPRQINSCELRGNRNCTPGAIINPKFKPNCCTFDSPCGLGEGGCSSDATCMNNLVCGDDNCEKDGGGRTSCCATPWDMPGLQNHRYQSSNLLFRM